MKKILATILAVLMIAATFTLPVFAEQVDWEDENITLNIDNAAVAPKIDGKLDADSYKKIDIKANQLTYNDGDVGAMDFLQSIPVEAYISYDAANVYVFLSGDATKFYYCDHDADSAGDIWNQSCMQGSFALADAEGDARLEMGLARNSSTGEAISNIWAQSPDGSKELDLVNGQNYAITVEGGRINYEMAIPFDTFLKSAPKAGDKIRFNFCFGFADNGTRMFVEYSSGCGINGKKAEMFALATLTSNVLQAAPVVEETTVAAEQPAAAENNAAVNNAVTTSQNPPATGDNTLAVLAVMILAAAGFVIFRKKVSVK